MNDVQIQISKNKTLKLKQYVILANKGGHEWLEMQGRYQEYRLGRDRDGKGKREEDLALRCSDDILPVAILGRKAKEGLAKERKKSWGIEAQWPWLVKEEVIWSLWRR